MSKFCGNCGAELTDDANVCDQCGTPVDRVSTDIQDQKKQKKTKTKIKLFVGAIALIVVVVIALNIVPKYMGYNGLLRQVMTAYEKYDIDTLVDLSSDIFYYDSVDRVEYYFENNVGDDLDFFESSVGHNYKLSYDIQEIYTISGRKLDSLLYEIESSYPDFDISTISQVKGADIEITAKKGEESVDMLVQITMTKENGKWKLLLIE